MGIYFHFHQPVLAFEKKKKSQQWTWRKLKKVDNRKYRNKVNFYPQNCQFIYFSTRTENYVGKHNVLFNFTPKIVH